MSPFGMNFPDICVIYGRRSVLYEIQCILRRSSADLCNYFTNMASGRRPEHQAPPDVVRLLCFFLFSKAVLEVHLLCVIFFSSFTMQMKPVNIRPSK